MATASKKQLQEFVKDGKTFVGAVVSAKMQKTAVVSVERIFRHDFYGKIVKKSKKYKMHDENNICSEGDLVEMVHVRPLSKTKFMVLKRVLSKKSEL